MILVSIILPTYNEAENMGLIIPALAEVMSTSNLSYEILVVDDDSPDGTAEVAQALSREYPVRVTIRKHERGLATAAMKGFDLAYGKIVVLMDADMSHPVEKVPAMIRPIEARAIDATVGSRYTQGGGSENWPWVRCLISQGAGLLARGVTRLSDPTSGFMAIRKSLLNGVELDPVGWKIVLEVIVKVNPTFMEIPIFFTDRIKGESKLSFKAKWDYLRHLRRLYCYKYPDMLRFYRFCLVGLSGMAIDTVILVALVEIAALDSRIAAIFAFLVAVSWNFRWNQNWTFLAAEYRKGTYLRYASFVLICMAGLAIRISVMHFLLLHTVMREGRGYILASIMGILAATVSNFLGSKYVAFSQKRA